MDDPKNVNDQLVTLTATTETLKASLNQTGQKIDAVQITVNQIQNLLAQPPAPVAAPATAPAPIPAAAPAPTPIRTAATVTTPAPASVPGQPACKITIADRLHGLIEIFYGLAIASGLGFVSTYIVAPDPAKGDYPIGSPMWWVMLWAVGIALLASLSDWFDSAQYHKEYTRPMFVIYDLAFTLALFFMFVGAFRFEIFLGAVVAYSVVAFFYFVVMARPKGWQIKAVGYFFILAACGWSLYCQPTLPPDFPALIPQILVPAGLITGLLFVTMVIRWQQLCKVIRERT